jgi:DNA polymerase-3 subunit delta'
VARARAFLESTSRRAARDTILGTLSHLAEMDELDVLDAARDLLAAVRAPLDDVKAAHTVELQEREEFLGSGTSRAVEERQKRELTAAEREGIAEVLNVAESWLRDCLVLSEGASDLVLNTDAIDAMEPVAAVITPAAASVALTAVKEARRRISYNVSPHLAVEAMLFEIREVLLCPR